MNRDNEPVPPTGSAAAPSGRTAGVAQTRTELGNLRPDLVERYDAAVPGARAAVLARLLGALDREPLPGVTGRCREATGGTGRVTVTGGRALRFPAAAAAPFAVGEPGLAAEVTAGPDRSRHTIDDPAALARALWPDSDLPAELDNSAANLALARAARPDTAPDLATAAGDPDGGGRLEQLVTDGHPLHPCCRTRGGMTVADVLAYGPEHRPVIRLRRLRVPADRWYGDAPPVLYAHPWQARRLRERYGWLADDGETGPVR